MRKVLPFVSLSALISGWGGDPFATAMVLKTLPAINLLDSDGDGIPDVVRQS